MPKRVLVAPLNWGLGHATRCIPVIEELLRQGAEVVLASDGRAYQLLQQEFPNHILEKLPSYNIRYQTNNMIWNLGVQAPKMLWAIWQEHWYLKKLIKKHDIDGIISDSRFGCFSRSVKSILIAHQINIFVPNRLLQIIIRSINRFFFQQFTECWIPDLPGERSIAGKLAQSSPSKKLKYIGILSRMQPLHLPIKYDVLVILSGPEPQRTRLETLLLQQINALPYRFLVVQGKPEGNATERPSERETERRGEQGNVEIISFLNSKEMNEAIATSEVVIGRAGYSTIMDLAVLGKKAIFIPTPGQTEQEYLAERLFEKQLFYYQKQSELNLAEALEKGKDFSGLKWQDYRNSNAMLKAVVRDLMNSSPPNN